MKTKFLSLFMTFFVGITVAFSQVPGADYNNTDFKLKAAKVYHEVKYDALIFEITVE